ncbi:hypothetical protein H5410_019300 [Solanum commersonii]|uniref:Uncharacterized protein n=1 Tax=Solanum commersonii TaxID=4109 RepID=A0A9J6A5K2_SOLCO|nr:hypothetical protein H5410_019300 [Solanum commersonii]
MREKLMTMGAWRSSGDAYNMGDKTTSCIREATREGVGGGMEKFKAKWKQNDCLSKVGKMKAEEEIRTHKEIYKATKTEAKLAKAREKARDLNQVKCIKDEEDLVLVIWSTLRDIEILGTVGVLRLRRLSALIVVSAGEERPD